MGEEFLKYSGIITNTSAITFILNPIDQVNEVPL